VFKKYKMRVFIKFSTFFVIGFLALSCVKNDSVKNNKPIVYVSIAPQKYMVEMIGGEVFEVRDLLPPGASPATFEPSPKQLKDLSDAIAYIRIGEIGFEKAWMERIQAINKNMTVFNQSRGVDFIEADHAHDHHHGSDDHDHHCHGGIDPHIWVSVSQMQVQIENIRNDLVSLMPDSANYFNENYEKLKVVLVDTDKKIMGMFNSLERKTFMIYHPALSYFARDYGLEQLPLEFEGKEPSGKYMVELIDKSKALGIGTIFIQKQFPEDKARAIAKELGADVVKIDPLAYSWPENMIQLAEQIKKSLAD
jgi:zinc transport system substrate-binding protein